MNTDHDDFELGESVTRQAKGKERRQTAVLSVRLPLSEISALERVSEACGKASSQIIREALSAYLGTIGVHGNQPSITIAWGNGGASFSTGPARSSNRATRSETWDWHKMDDGVKVQ